MTDMAYDGYPELADRVDEARRAWARTYVTENVLRFIALFGGAVLLLSLIASLGPMLTVLRWAMLGVLAVLLVGGAIRFVFRPLFREWTDEEVAIHVEARFPEIDNAVINSLQLARDPLVREHALVARMIRDAERRTRGLQFAESVEHRRLGQFAAAASVVVAALAVFAFGFGDSFGRALHRILLPMAHVRAVGTAEIVEVRPGHTTVIAGDPLEIQVRYRRLGGAEVDAVLRCDTTSREMKPLGDDRFALTLPEVRRPFRYRVVVGGTESDRYRVDVTELPAVTRIDLRHELPAYTGLAPTSEADTNGDVKALAGTKVRLTVTASKAVRDGAIRDYGPPVALAVDPTNPRRLTGTLVVTKSGSYTVRLTDRDGHDNRSPVIHRVTALPDRRPTVRVTSPGRDVAAQPGDRVAIGFEAKDDYGLAKAELHTRLEGTKAEPMATATWTTFADRRHAQPAHTLVLDPKTCRPGQVVEYWVQVTDNRQVDGTSAGQTARTPPFLIKIEDRTKLAEEKIRRLAGWQERLRKVLDAERAVRQGTVAMHQLDRAEPFDALVASALKSQVAARLDVMRIAGDVRPTDAALRRIRDVLYALAGNEMADAVKRAEAVQRTAPLDEKKKALQKFETAVDRVIAAIEKILDVLPKLQEQAKKEADEDEPFDLSQDAKDKLTDLERGLKDFIDQQKKVIDATQELAQKNVDDFTKEDDKKLKALEATEDKWSQFLVEKHNDLSKLPEQDLANSTLLKELLEVQSEVKMAKGALAKKATEIATAIENNGLELAKSLETHIEKWLADEPDRKKWQMEETLGDAEAPMAELPKELEDLVGELMEEEEDLMDEVEDATAGYADSLDKGAGWEAADGPISNMSAQGVTGNQLPNKSEIGGRSGEGRSGKSAGEFVEQDATGKGGRKTPTRLTPDAYEKGQVNDTSKDPMGGSTGGGKASGAGAGGLEGPVPPAVQAKLKNLAARQAELRNKAENINAKFKVMSWPTPFDETVKAMKLTEDDLRNSRYQNALRRRPIMLKNLKTTRTFLQDQVRIHRDYSTALPKYLQDELLDAGRGGTPRGYGRLLQDYYKSITKPGE